MRILGIVTRTHDSGLALLEQGSPTLILEEERFNREKHTRKFPFCSLKAAFNDRGLDLAEVDVITTPWHMRSRSVYKPVIRLSLSLVAFLARKLFGGRPPSPLGLYRCLEGVASAN